MSALHRWLLCMTLAIGWTGCADDAEAPGPTSPRGDVGVDLPDFEGPGGGGGAGGQGGAGGEGGMGGGAGGAGGVGGAGGEGGAGGQGGVGGEGGAGGQGGAGGAGGMGDAGGMGGQPVRCEDVADPYPDLDGRREGRFLFVDEFPGREMIGARALRIHLPAAYDAEPERRFPVLYMHDGQNLFDRRAAAFGTEWQADENADALVDAGLIEPIIIVGVDNGGANRIFEYTPSEDPEVGSGGGAEAYAAFLVEQVKPWVDTHLRTQCDRAHTGVAGSSLGGLISFYLMDHHPEVFGRYGVVSPSFWWNNNEIVGWLDRMTGAWRPGTRLWLDGGTGEGADPDGDGLTTMVDDIRVVRDAFVAAEAPSGLTEAGGVVAFEVPGAPHNEAAWAGRMDHILRFMWGTLAPAQPMAITLHRLRNPIGVGQRAALAVEADFGGALRFTLPFDEAVVVSRDPEIVRVEEAAAVGVSGGRASLTATVGELETSAEIEVSGAEPGEVMVRFEVTVPAATPPNAPVNLTGDLPQLGGWNPAIGLELVRGDAGIYTGSITVATGTEMQFKATRGSWETVEKGPNDEEIANRRAVAEAGLVVQVVVARWRDQAP